MKGQAARMDQGSAPARRAERWALGALLALFLAMAALYFAVVPPLEGFDAPAHYGAVTHLRATRRLPVLNRETLQASYELITQPPLYHALAALAAAPWPVEPTQHLAASSLNPYFEKGLSERQTVTLPGASWAARAPIHAARAVSLVGALLAVAATWRLARTLVPQPWSFALAVTGVVAFNPVFLYLAVTVTNDSWAAGTAALTVALAADAALRHKPPRAWLWAGAAGGLALLAKYSGFLVGLPALALLGVYARRRGMQAALAAAGWSLLGGALVAGGIYGRNLMIYGELAPLQRMAEVIPSLNRAEPWPWGEVWATAPWLVWSYWGVFVATIAPPAFLEAMGVFMGVGLIGLPLALLRDNTHTRWTLALALLWALPVAAAVIYWTRTVSFGEQGRLAHIAAPALALLWVIGWQAWLPLRWRPLLHAALTLGMAGLALWGAHILHAAYHLPPALETVTPDRVVDAHFDGGPVLVGADFPNGAALAPGSPMPVTLYWTSPHPIGEDYTIFLHLADADNDLVYQFDGVPAAGRHPTRQWRAGETFADPYTVVIEPIGQAGLATLSVGLYPVADAEQRLAVRDAQGAELGDRVILAQVRLHTDTTTPAPPTATRARWENGIALVEAEVQMDAAEQPAAVSLTWRSETAQQQEWTRFVQVLDVDNRVLAQMDGAPQAGAWPTSTWRAGEQIDETVTLIPAPGAALTTWQRVVVGWYDRAGARLILAGPHTGQDILVVMERGD